MKRFKYILIGVAIVILIIGIGVVYMFWQMGQPIYTFGSVSSAENLRSSLTPPEQMDPNRWQVEPDISLHYDAYGKGRPVIIVHGGPGIPYAKPWDGLRSLEESYKFYYYHQRGAGKSTRPIQSFESKNYPKNVTVLEQTLGIGAQIADIERIRRILNEEKLLLVGHSFGGFIAALYAAEFPENVEKLLLVAPAAMLSPPKDGDDFFANIRKELPEEDLSDYDVLVKEYFNFGSIFSKTDDDLVDLQKRIGKYLLKGMGYKDVDIESHPVPGGWSTFAVYFSTGRLPRFRSAVKQIIAPTLIIHGKDDLLSLKGSQEYGNIIPNAKFVSIRCHNPSGISGHFFFDDCPTEFSDEFLRFLNE
ncbi:alpha/beta hydrolase [Candidatus Poribacteria bacterium]|nr:MAG: alpha/beta hydrolase [Candidatus Poribacteria bacterium]